MILSTGCEDWSQGHCRSNSPRISPRCCCSKRRPMLLSPIEIRLPKRQDQQKRWKIIGLYQTRPVRCIKTPKSLYYPAKKVSTMCNPLSTSRWPQRPRIYNYQFCQSLVLARESPEYYTISPSDDNTTQNARYSISKNSWKKMGPSNRGRCLRCNLKIQGNSIRYLGGISSSRTHFVQALLINGKIYPELSGTL